MNQKEFKKVRAKELRQLLESLGATRLEIAQGLGVGESSLRRWIRNKAFPVDVWERITSEDFQHDFRVIQEYTPRRYKNPSEGDKISFEEMANDKSKKDVLYSLPPPGTPLEVLMEASLEDLVDAIEERGWNVTLNRRPEDM